MNQNIFGIACFVWEVGATCETLGTCFCHSKTKRAALHSALAFSRWLQVTKQGERLFFSPQTHISASSLAPLCFPHWVPRSLFVCANVITCPQGVPLNITLNSQQHNQLFPLAERLVYLISLLETVISRKAFNTLLILTASGNSIVNQKHGKSNRRT